MSNKLKMKWLSAAILLGLAGVASANPYTIRVPVKGLTSSAAGASAPVTAPGIQNGTNALTFGNQVDGTSSSAQSVTLTNTGTATLTFSSIYTDNSAFAATTNCASVSPNGQCSVNVTFAPTTQAGAVSGNLFIMNNATNQTVTLSGTAQANVVASGSTHNWSDGTYAASCLAYLTGNATHVYSGATGNGVYRIQPSGQSATDVYCDMTGGGWTLLAMGTGGTGFSPTNTAWYNATGALSVPATPSTTGTWKYADTFINAVNKSVFKLVGSGGYTATRYASGTCVYAHNTTVSGACAQTYSDVALTTGLRTGNQGGGISDNNGSGYYIFTNNSSGYATFGWCVGNASTGGCGNYGSLTNLQMWVK